MHTIVELKYVEKELGWVVTIYISRNNLPCTIPECRGHWLQDLAYLNDGSQSFVKTGSKMGKKLCVTTWTAMLSVCQTYNIYTVTYIEPTFFTTFNFSGAFSNNASKASRSKLN